MATKTNGNMPANHTSAADDPASDAIAESLNDTQDRSDNFLDVADQTPQNELSGEDRGDGHEAPQILSEDDIRNFFQFDPTQSSDQDEGDEGQDDNDASTQPDVTNPGTPVVQAQESSPGDQGAATLQQLQARVAEQDRLIQALLAGQQQRPQQPERRQQQQEDPNQRMQREMQELQPLYNWPVPNEIAEAIGSENPSERGQALQNLLAVVASVVHRNVRQELGQKLDEFGQNLPQVVGQQMQTHRRDMDIAADFYGTYPLLNNTQIRGTVPQIAQQVMRAMGTSDWSPQVRDAVAKKVVQDLGQALGTDLSYLLQREMPQQRQVMPPANGQRVNGQRQLPPRKISGGARSAPQTPQSALTAEIMNTLG